MDLLPLCVFLVLAAQDKPGHDNPGKAPVPPLPPGRTAAKSAGENVDLKRGELPAQTPADVAAAWDRLVRASLPNAPKVEDPVHPPALPARAPVTAFDLSIDVRYRASDAQSNDLPQARYRWLAPSFFRADTGRGAAHLRGPQGSFLIDSSRADAIKKVPLDVGRENVEDRKQLNEEAGLAGNFAGLADPRSLRIQKIASVGAPMSTLPEALQQRARELAWLEIESPDFSAVQSGGKSAPMARVQLGVDPKTSLPEIAVVQDASRPAGLSASTSVLQLFDWKAADDFLIPRHIVAWLPQVSDPDAPERHLSMRQKPAMEMYVMKAQLRASLTPQDFAP